MVVRPVWILLKSLVDSEGFRWRDVNTLENLSDLETVLIWQGFRTVSDSLVIFVFDLEVWLSFSCDSEGFW